jgi:hypothetical protein
MVVVPMDRHHSSQSGLLLSIRAEETNELMAASLLGIILEIPLDLVFIAAIGGIYRMQMAHVASLAQPVAPQAQPSS